MNILDLDEWSGEESPFSEKVLGVQRFLAAAGGKQIEEDGYYLTLLQKAIIAAYAAKGINETRESLYTDPAILRERVPSATRRQYLKQMPTLSDVSRELKQLGDDGKKVADILYSFIDPQGLGKIFNTQSNFSLDSRLISFNLKELPRALEVPGLLGVLEFCLTRIRRDRRRRMMVVDEAWKLMRHRESAAYLDELARTVRKHYCSLMTVTQLANDFLSDQWGFGRSISTNSAIRILLRQATTDMDLVAHVFELTEAEQEYLKTANPGHALFISGDLRVNMYNVVSDEERKLYDTSPQI